MRFFVYDLVDPRDGSTFYVGKGVGNRPAAHTREALSGKRSRKCERIREIHKEGFAARAVVVQRFESEEDAYRAEVERIAEIGLANLTNVLPGGRGGMAQAVRLAEQLPRSMVHGIAKVLILAERGLKVSWGGFDCTKFAQETLDRLIDRMGRAAVEARFTATGYRLLTEQNNAVR